MTLVPPTPIMVGLHVAPAHQSNANPLAVATVGFATTEVTLSESDEQPTWVCLVVSGEFDGRSVDLTLDADDASSGECDESTYCTIQIDICPISWG